MTSCRLRHVAWALLVVGSAMPALAQQPPQPPQQQPPRSRACTQLEAQLSAFDRAANDPARADQVRRLEEAVTRQQVEIDRNTANARRIGCEGGFFLFGGRPPQCGPLNAQIQTQRTNLDRMQAQLQQMQSTTGPEHQSQRHAILVALSQNDCGQQYRAAVAATQPPRGSLFDSLFGTNSIFINPNPSPDNTQLSGTFRTLCVRTCDGYYYPISYSATPAKFAEDTKICTQSCPAAEVSLYAHRNPGEDVNQAVQVTTQQPYTALPNAFRYRTSFDPNCTCRHPGESWANALKHVDDTVQQGDVVVNEQRAKQLSQPRFDANGKPIKIDPRAARPTVPTAAPAASPAAATTTTDNDEPTKPDPKRKVRAVGPIFIPAR
jgi:hypothetical protein